MSRVLLASRNAKKLKELRRVVAAAGLTGLEVVGLDDVPEYPEEPETGATFEENALIKARSGARATGLPCVADDSGIEVDALNGMPGVLSARWSGRHGDDQANNDLLLAQLSDVPAERRGAGFVSACALVLPDGAETVVRGEWRGELLWEPKGVNGFGYDPLFAPADEVAEGRSSAQLSPDEKDAISHRGKALARLVPALNELVVS
ncbi:RdgB/HAM1 family non-canonical purine NTP pyrophosphatase [Gordonia sp. TBRC 11910]|uniref:dITP/XTP pyrophosphatase n=1 Tax=Gordonia asplenii TaxID=2725283 RepID=A0A848L1H3_9ACTN|nr:RdgB/HAM1 family non-canonical purine NTP pyrophosphatase [Gordonia asplenii]NMO04307.1 RdgB/HAM1 family non-canonical purine NTP pyrophosphatase [Gordonia asplenii]